MSKSFKNSVFHMLNDINFNEMYLFFMRALEATKASSTDYELDHPKIELSKNLSDCFNYFNKARKNGLLHPLFHVSGFLS